MKKIYLFACVLIVAACKKSSVSTTTTTKSADTTLTVRANIIPGAPGCSEILVQGDPYYTLPNGDSSAFSGYADACIRKDPQSSTIYMAYSWPNYNYINNLPVGCVDGHLAKSTDGGNTWVFVKSLWPSVALNNAVSPYQQGYMNSETPNILPVTVNNTTTWYAARHNYFIYNTGSGQSGEVTSSEEIRIFKASSPETLDTAPYTILHTSQLNSAWGGNQNLALLDPSLNDVTLFGEPALYYDSGTLYLTLVSFVYTAPGVPDMTQNNVHVFSTTPTGDPNTWNWAYRGELAGQADASALGGQGLTQVEIAKGTDGQLLMITSPEDYVSSLKDYDHKGCKVVEIQSLSTPALAKDANGNLKVRVSLTQSDAYELGSGSSAYDPNSSTGIIFARRLKTTGLFTSSLWRTSIKP